MILMYANIFAHILGGSKGGTHAHTPRGGGAYTKTG